MFHDLVADNSDSLVVIRHVLERHAMMSLADGYINRFSQSI